MTNIASQRGSIIISCYNLGHFLEEALTSAININYPDFEVIVVNDGSTDKNTLQVLEELENNYRNNPTVKFIHQTNKGLSSARNTGIQNSTGTYILPLDADNKLRPDYLGKAIKVLENNPKIGVVYAYAQRFGDKNDIWALEEFTIPEILQDNKVDACAVMRRQVWEDCGGFDEELFKIGYEDWDLWLGAIEKGWGFHLIKEVLFDYRVRSNSMVTFCSTPKNWDILTTNLRTKHKSLYERYWPREFFSKEHQLTKLQELSSKQELVINQLKKNNEQLASRVLDLEQEINSIKAQKQVSPETRITKGLSFLKKKFGNF